jgi:hypothetical protein
VLTDDEFVSVVERAKQLRAEVTSRGIRGAQIDASVRARLYWKPEVPLAAGEAALANDIHELLADWRLSQPQAAQLEHEYFPPAGRT